MNMIELINGAKVKEGDIICIFLDFINLWLSYSINGKDYGIAFKIKKSKYRLQYSRSSVN